MEAMTTDTANADIRAVFFDIDGTLTSFTTHTVPDSTIEAIHRLQAAGVKVLICTGRAPSQMHVVLDTMPVTFDGVVAFNGQYCFDDTGFFASQALDTADIEVILDWLAPAFLSSFPSNTYAPPIVPTFEILNVCLISALPIICSSYFGASIPFIAA